MKPKYKYSVRECLIDLIDWLGESDSLLQLNEIRKKSEETVPQERWKPKNNTKYYLISYDGRIDETTWDIHSMEDRFRHLIGNCFPHTKKGKKQAEAYRQKLIDLGKE